MHIRSGKTYHPYPRECQGHPRDIVHLRRGRTYRHCTRGHHPNRHRRQRVRTAPRPPPELPLEIINAIFRELLINSDIPLDALTSNLLVCRTWNTIVSGLVCRDTNVQRKLILTALESEDFDAAEALIGKYNVDARRVLGDEWIRAYMHMACLHGHLRLFLFLMDRCQAFEGTSIEYVADLGKLAFGRMNLAIWFEMIERGYVDIG